MLKNSALRLLLLIPTVCLISLLAFALLYHAPGNAAQLLLQARTRSSTLTREDVTAFAEDAGLNKSFGEMYTNWMRGVLRGDFGFSYISGQSINGKLMAGTCKTLAMTGIAMATYIPFGLLAGVLAASSRRGLFEKFARYWAVLSTAIPVFWLSLFVVWLLSVKFGVLATVGRRGNSSLILPGVLMGLVYAGNLIMIVKEKTLVTLEEPYVLSARALGIRRGVILRRHVLPHLLAPVAATSALSFSSFLGAGVLMESIFSINGLGTLLTEAINVKDYGIVASATLVIGVLVCVFNMAAEIFQSMIDRRGTSCDGT